MDPKDRTFYPLIILFFLLGLILGYMIHQPGTVELIKYINKTTEVTGVPVETTAEATWAPTPTVPTPTPEPADFTVRNYDPFKDKPSETIELTNWRVVPDALSVTTKDVVLIKITDYTLQSPVTLILNSTYNRNIGTAGAVIVSFNKKGIYSLVAIVNSTDPTILPKEYGKGTIAVN